MNKLTNEIILQKVDEIFRGFDAKKRREFFCCAIESYNDDEDLICRMNEEEDLVGFLSKVYNCPQDKNVIIEIIKSLDPDKIKDDAFNYFLTIENHWEEDNSQYFLNDINAGYFPHYDFVVFENDKEFSSEKLNELDQLPEAERIKKVKGYNYRFFCTHTEWGDNFNPMVVVTNLEDTEILYICINVD